ncbi:MAG: arginyltransferase [Candidatus Obscuribacterales bacterium]|nr:arginyltransferase [Candidatus Obscuribacterales bacterium]
MPEDSADPQYIPPPLPCPYLPDQIAQMHYEIKSALTSAEYLDYINEGWRRFGNALFHPVCPSCRACQPIRIVVEKFKPNRSQKRVIKQNKNKIKLVIGQPKIDAARHDLYMRHHAHHNQIRGWPKSTDLQAITSIREFISGPLAVEEWSYYLDEELVGICYVDSLPSGYSGMYFYHAPEHRQHSLGTWMCLSMIERAAELQLPYVYLGYYIKGCISMEYKNKFKPNQVLYAPDDWRDF